MAMTLQPRLTTAPSGPAAPNGDNHTNHHLRTKLRTCDRSDSVMV